MSKDPRLPGFLRVQEIGKRPYYRSPFPRKVLNGARVVQKFLDKQHADGKLLEVEADMFTFKRERNLQEQDEMKELEAENHLLEEEHPKTTTDVTSLQFWVEQMTPHPDVSLNHKVELSKVASLLDEKLVSHEEENDQLDEENIKKFDDLKEKLLESRDAAEMMDVLYADPVMTKMMNKVTYDVCLGEISKINTKKGPLAEFPPSVNTNIYCKIVEFGLQEAPVTMEFYFGFVVKQGHTVRPSHVVKLATLFANLCYSTNRDLDALTTLRSLTLQLDRLTDQGLDLLSCQELTKTSRKVWFTIDDQK